MITDLSDFVMEPGLFHSLEKMLREKSVPGAILIEGNPGSGKKTLAGLIAAGILCSSDRKSPCGVCKSCKKAVTGHPDIIYADGGEKQTVSVDDIRNLRKEAGVLPNESSGKVIVITGKMAPPAQNALLKILEEPPKGVTFIITADRRESMLETVVSRCMPILLPALTLDRVEEFLRRKYPDIPSEKLKAAAECSSGLIGEAQRILSDKGREGERIMSKMIFSVAKQDPAGFLEAVHPLEKDPSLLGEIICKMGTVFRDAYVKKEGAGEGISGFPKEADALAGALTSQSLAEDYRLCEECSLRLDENPKMNLLLTVLCAEMIK